MTNKSYLLKDLTLNEQTTLECRLKSGNIEQLSENIKSQLWKHEVQLWIHWFRILEYNFEHIEIKSGST